MGNEDFNKLMKRPARISLDALRDQVHEAQNGGSVQHIAVNREGQIVMGREAAAAERTLSEVPLEVFAGRLDSDQRVVAQYLPRNTKRIRTGDGVDGWGYEIRTELGDLFTLFLYFDGANYQVNVIHPEVEDRWRTPHTGHVYEDGRICFGHSYESGMPTLRAAYAKSVLWANGMSVAMRTEHFPFSINNSDELGA